MANQRPQTAEELDALIAAWEGDVGAINSNITLLKNTKAFRFLDVSSVKGTTLELVPKAFDAIKRMSANWAKLQVVVSEARTARGQLPRWGQKAAIDAIVDKFFTDSILMEVREIPLAERTATSGDKMRVMASPTKLKDQINADFQTAKTTLLKVDAKWELLNPQLSTLRDQVEGLRARFEEAGLENAPELDTLNKRFSTTETKYKSDPLGTADDIVASLRPYVTTAEGRLRTEEDRIKREQEAVAAKVEDARSKFEQLKGARVRALELYAQAQVGIDDPVKHGLTAPGSVKRLGEWLGEIETALTEKRFKDVTSALADWFIEYNSLNQSINGTIQANEEVSEKRHELLRRFAEAKAKYEANKAAIGESKSLATFERVAKEALTGKIKLDEAETAVQSYEVKLGELLARLPHTS